jgi:hypothetical protein
MKLRTQIAVLMLASVALSASAGPFREQTRRWAISGSAGFYGFVEIDKTPSASIYSKHDLETSVCLGRWSVTFPFSAPVTVFITLAPIALVGCVGFLRARSNGSRTDDTYVA